MSAIVFDDVTFTYPDAPATALDHVSLEIPGGTFCIVAGATGAGKSTFLRAINGLVPHFSGGTFSGRVLVGGRDTLKGAPRDLADVVAFVPQDPSAAFVVERVEDELAYALENLGIEQAQMRRRVEETLDLLALEPLRSRSVRDLSGGERQRVAIAAALTPRPTVLVLDEPTSQLDPQGAEDVIAALQRLVHDLGMTVVLAEHRLERVAGAADVAVGLSRGRAEIGDVATVVGRAVAGPPVMRLGRLAGWDPLPLTVRGARHQLAEVLGDAAASAPEPEADDAALDETGTSTAPLVQARGIHAGYPDRPVLRDVSLELRAGEVVALMGRNGSGKTTLLRVFVGVHEPERGTVAKEGKGIALCPQRPETILFRESVLDEIRTSVQWRNSAIDPRTLIEDFGLAGDIDKHPRDLSAGKRLLVACAATAASGADVLLLDEPTRGLDPDAKQRLASLLRDHAYRGGAVLFATHDVELVAEIAGRVVMLAGGEVIASGTPADVLGDSPVFAPQMSRVVAPGWLTPEQVYFDLLEPLGAP